ncbi:MAG: hypothetical protein GX054_01785 [Clostridiales bacterium]|nr:hypothetical protein [Clostridiales bacterium]
MVTFPPSSTGYFIKGSSGKGTSIASNPIASSIVAAASELSGSVFSSSDDVCVDVSDSELALELESEVDAGGVSVVSVLAPHRVLSLPAL